MTKEQKSAATKAIGQYLKQPAKLPPDVTAGPPNTAELAELKKSMPGETWHELAAGIPAE